MAKKETVTQEPEAQEVQEKKSADAKVRAQEVLEHIVQKNLAQVFVDDYKDQEVLLASGVRAIIRGVGMYALTAARASVPDPEVPMYTDPDKGIAEENKNDPAYREALEAAEVKRNEAMADVIMLLGVELVDPVDPEGDWLKRLKKLERLGHIDLSEFDFSDPLDIELAYKRYVAVSRPDLNLVMAASSGLSVDALQKARRMFLGNQERSTD